MPDIDALPKPKPGIQRPTQREDLTTHGGEAVGVYFAALVGEPNLESQPGTAPSPSDEEYAQLRAASERLRDDFGGLEFASTDCDDGARAALAAAGYKTVSLYLVLHFPDETDAHAFAAGVDPPPLAVATVHTYCRDGIDG